MNKEKLILDPMVFVRDENDPAFRAHIIRRAQEAADPKNRLPLTALKDRLAKYQQQVTINA
jgi:hypothetical protein